MKLTTPQRTILLIQSLYFVLTATWPIFDIESFMKVTGYKTDQWLVITVSFLILSSGITMMISRSKNRIVPELFPSLVLSSVFLMAIEIYYSLNEIISKIYLLDAVAELFFLSFWIITTRGLKDFLYQPDQERKNNT